MTAPAHLPALVLAMSFFMMVATLLGLNRVLIRASWPDGRRMLVLRAAAVLLIGWLAVALALALVGVYEDRPPAIQLGFVISFAIAAVLIWQSRRSAAVPL